MSWKKSIVALVILSLVVTAGLAGCGKKTAEPAKPGEEMAAEQVLRYNLGTEPETLDSAKATGQPEFTVINALFEGLTRMDKNYMPQPAMAKEWKLSDDGKTYTFILRDGIKWSNGDPVTAQDFEFAWKRVLDPATAADYAYQLYYVKNGQAFNEGKATADEVGVKAVDEKTLEVTLESPAPYFLGLTSFPSLFPVPKKVVEGNENWAAAAETIVTNGPFKLTLWEHNSKLEMVKNPDYWDANSVKLAKMVWPLVEESSTELTMFETGEIDFGDNPPSAELARLKESGSLVIGPDLATYYYIFNVTKKPFDNPKVRKAFALAIDRKALVENVTKAGQKPAMGFVPSGIPNPVTGKDFRAEAGDFFKDADAESAKKLLAEAGYADGKGLPPIEVLYNTSEGHKAIAEAIQEMWKKNLGVENVTLTNQEWKVYLQTRDEGNFMVARAGWGGDYLDPMTFLDMWTKDNGNNNTFWSSEEYDRLVAEAKATADQKTRFEKMHRLEQILMDEMPIIPIYFYTDAYVIKPYVKDVVKMIVGPSVEFKYAWIAKH